MHNLTRLLALSLAASIVSPIFAQPGGDRGPGGPGGHGGPGGPGGRFGRHFGHPIVRAIDADKDAVLSAAELSAASAAILTLDTNTDGVVTAAELHPLPPNAPARPANPNKPEKNVDRPRPIDPVMLALDADANGDLSAVEIANAPASLNALDDNEDGQLTRDEVCPLPPE
jgi:hypothetical protein